jgi:hypothetical protein
MMKPTQRRTLSRPSRRPRDQVQDAIIGMTVAMILGCFALLVGLWFGRGCAP